MAIPTNVIPIQIQDLAFLSTTYIRISSTSPLKAEAWDFWGIRSKCFKFPVQGHAIIFNLVQNVYPTFIDIECQYLDTLLLLYIYVH
jgi:hypothetical protein